jgi:hypothetical protein
VSCSAVNAEYMQLFASTLVSRPAIKFTLDQRKSGVRQVATLMYSPSNAEPRALAVIEVSELEGREEVVVHLLSASGAPVDPEVEVAAIERLYTLALNLNPEASFCLSRSGSPCNPTMTVSSHALLLREILLTREAALKKSRLPGTPWHVVSMMPTVKDSGSADRASVRVTVAGIPLPGRQIFFSRAPHSGCVAKTGADGVATCELFDQHGDQHEHDDEHAIVANFPGDVTAERIFPPTTSVVATGKQ